MNVFITEISLAIECFMWCVVPVWYVMCLVSITTLLKLVECDYRQISDSVIDSIAHCGIVQSLYLIVIYRLEFNVC